MTERKDKQDIYAVVLAAGLAERFGSTKQLAEFKGSTLVRRAVDLAAEACGNRYVLVVGHDWRAVSDACMPLTGFIVYNDSYADGIGSSIARATSAIGHVARAIVVLLADQPLISATHLHELCDAWTGAGNEIVATDYAGTLGVPALFGNSCFDDLAALAGDTGARRLLTSGKYRVHGIPFEPAAVDIDTPADLEKL